MTTDVLEYTVKDGVAFITLNRPDKLNALDAELTSRLLETWDRFESDPAAHVAILAGAGRAFCAGADVSPSDGEKPNPDLVVQLRSTFAQNGIKVFKPVIGAVQGYALGVGAWLAIRGCDITLAGESAKFGYPEARIGSPITPPEYTPYLNFKASLEFLLLAWNGGEIFDAKRALELGLVNRVVPDVSLQEEAIRWARMLMKVPPLFIKSVKHGHYKVVQTAVAEHDRAYLDYVHPQAVSKDRVEAASASRERRDPKFRGQ